MKVQQVSKGKLKMSRYSNISQKKLNFDCRFFSFSSSSYLHIKIFITNKAISGMARSRAEMLKLDVKKSTFIPNRCAFLGCSCSVAAAKG